MTGKDRGWKWVTVLLQRKWKPIFPLSMQEPPCLALLESPSLRLRLPSASLVVEPSLEKHSRRAEV